MVNPVDGSQGQDSREQSSIDKQASGMKFPQVGNVSQELQQIQQQLQSIIKEASNGGQVSSTSIKKLEDQIQKLLKSGDLPKGAQQKLQQALKEIQSSQSEGATNVGGLLKAAMTIKQAAQGGF